MSPTKRYLYIDENGYALKALTLLMVSMSISMIIGSQAVRGHAQNAFGRDNRYYNEKVNR